MDGISRSGLHRRSALVTRLIRQGGLALIVVLSLLGLPHGVVAAVGLTVSPITWNVVGLDSNDVMAGPDTFPIGARVCNAGSDAATDVRAVFAWDDGRDLFEGDPTINLRPGSLDSIPLGTLEGGACRDAYFELALVRDPNAYGKTRRYTVTATADGGVVASTPRPREIVVERLISQSRNAITGLSVNGESVPAGGTTAVVVGGTYEIRLTGTTATNGYEQLETFASFPNTIFRINSVTTTFTANGGTDPWATSKLYADGCRWENDPNSPNYLACSGSGKYGGTIDVTYNVTVIGGAGTAQPIHGLIYDYSGSSFHYCADYGSSDRTFVIVGEAGLSFEKAFSPGTVSAGGISRLVFRIANPSISAVRDISFSDVLPTEPGAMVVADPAAVVTSGCGTPEVVAEAGSGSVAVDDIAVGAGDTCTIGVNVTAPLEGSYANTAGPLWVAATGSGTTAEATLLVGAPAPLDPPPTSCAVPVTLATWTFENVAASTATNPGPFPASAQAEGLSGALGSYRSGGTGGSASSIATPVTYPTGWNPPATTGATGNAWGIRGGWLNSGVPTGATVPAFEFEVPNAAAYGGYGLTASYTLAGNWSNGGNWYVLYSTDGTTWTQAATGPWNKSASWQIDAIPAVTASPATDTVRFRVFAASAQYTGNPSSTGAVMYLDNVRVTGCASSDDPLLSKAFAPDPVAVGGTSTLTFLLTNPNPNVLTGATFEDTLPAGLQVANPSNAATTCGGTASWAPAAGDTTLTFSRGSIPALGSCAASVDVVALTPGTHVNTSGFVATAETGVNETATGFASATLTALRPPTVAKLFTPGEVAQGGVAVLTFVLENPNEDDPLTGVAFSDVLPTTPGAMIVAEEPGARTSECGSPVFEPAPGAGTLSFSHGTLAPGGTCTVQVRVTAAVPGNYTNTTAAVTADIAGGTDSATATLTVRASRPDLAFAQQIARATSGPWRSFVAVAPGADVVYRFVVENTGDVALTSVGVSDPGLDPLACDWVDGNGTPLVAPFDLPPADADEGHLATCIVGPVAAEPGVHPNLATTSCSEADSVSDVATYATTALTLDVTALEATYDSLGDILTYRYDVVNSGSAPLLGPVTVTDTLVTVTCPAVSTVGDLDDYLDPGESLACGATYTVQAGDVGSGAAVDSLALASVEDVASNEDGTVVIYDASPTEVRFTGLSARAAMSSLYPGALVAAGLAVAVADRRRRTR